MKEPTNITLVEKILQNDTGITHLGFVHYETGVGVVNPIKEINELCQRFNKGLIIDAMSYFGALPISTQDITFDALISASGKCLEGVPGMGFFFIKKDILNKCQHNSCSLAMDLYDQYIYMEQTGQWRFTPPTHVIAALSEALEQLFEEGGPQKRLLRYTKNSEILLEELQNLGFKPLLKSEYIAPIIITFLAPKLPNYNFKNFYNAIKKEGFILFPGKLTDIETFRVGCIGAIGSKEMKQIVDSVNNYLKNKD